MSGTAAAGSMLAEALGYVARGWALLPTRRDKRPASELIRRTRGHHGWRSLYSRPAGSDEVAAWFELDPGAGVGVITGQPSQLAVVDVDDETRAPELPTSATVRTARGRHVYYAASEPVRSRDFAWGELKGDGRYVVAPPSRHGSGARYRWEISPGENGALADFASFSTPGTSISSTCFKVSTCSAPASTSAGKLADFERDEATALRLAAALGAPDGLRLGEAFRCLLHADGQPSAALWRREPGAHVLYHDFHSARHGERNWLTLAHVRARLAGRTGPLALPELTVWKLRLASEAGLLEPLALRVDADTPTGQSGLVWSGFLELLALRWLVTRGAPAPFSARFAAAWCGCSTRTAHEAVAELSRLGLLQLAGRVNRTRLWAAEGVVLAD